MVLKSAVIGSSLCPDAEEGWQGQNVGVGSTYADAGRPKTLKPTEQDRQHTGNIVAYFPVANKSTAQPLAPVFASGPHSATASTAVPSTQMTAPISGHSTEVIDVNQAVEATASEGLARMLADYGRGSDDADPSNEVPEVIDVDQSADSRMNDLWKKWTAQVRLTQHGKDWGQIRLPDSLIEKLETMIKSMSKIAKNVTTSWSRSLDDKQTVLAGFGVLDRK